MSGVAQFGSKGEFALNSEVLTASPPTLDKWKLSDAIVVGLVLTATAGLCLWFVPGSRIFPPWLHSTNFQRSQLSVLISLVAQLGAVTVMVTAIGKVRGIVDPLSSIGWNLNRYVWVCALAGFGIAAAITLASLLIPRLVSRFADGFAPASIGLFFVTTVLVGPFIEECYFRGLLFVALSERFGNFGSLIVTTLLFGLIHLGGYRFILVFWTVGMVLGIARIKTRSVAACFVLHAAYNIGILVSGLLHAR
jgi:membrane protease YdiL (CAAX protease family)